MRPIVIFNNWSAYDELSDDVKLTEELAMRQLDEVLRLRALGVRIDGYLMDAFWYAADGAYRTWRPGPWPQGPDRWLRTCLDNDVIPGLWFATNRLSFLEPSAAWEDSLNRQGTALCMFDGGFLDDLVAAFQHWYDRGVRLYKLDFADMSAATPAAERAHLPDEIRALNAAALRGALVKFSFHNPEARFLAYNGFGGQMDNTSVLMQKTVDVRWLDAFDSLYCGDPRPADVPMMSFWRSVDIYTDHMLRYYEFNGVPLDRIDNMALMIGRTGTCYGRGASAWKGSLILQLARGSLVNTHHGDLGLLDDDDARWLAAAQSLFLPFLERGRVSTFGGVPGRAEPYGLMGRDGRGAVITIVNPGQCVAAIPLPHVSSAGETLQDGRILFTDAGRSPELGAGMVKLGPEQLCVIGYGAYADSGCDLGLEKDVVIPTSIEPVPATFEDRGANRIRAEITPPESGDMRIIMTQHHRGMAYRSSGGAPPGGQSLGHILRIAARQGGRVVPIHVEYDKMIWSGLSWAAGEIRRADIQSGQSLVITCSSGEDRLLDLDGRIYRVTAA